MIVLEANIAEPLEIRKAPFEPREIELFRKRIGPRRSLESRFGIGRRGRDHREAERLIVKLSPDEHPYERIAELENARGQVAAAMQIIANHHDAFENERHMETKENALENANEVLEQLDHEDNESNPFIDAAKTNISAALAHFRSHTGKEGIMGANHEAHDAGLDGLKDSLFCLLRAYENHQQTIHHLQNDAQKAEADLKETQKRLEEEERKRNEALEFLGVDEDHLNDVRGPRLQQNNAPRIPVGQYNILSIINGGFRGRNVGNRQARTMRDAPERRITDLVQEFVQAREQTSTALETLTPLLNQMRTTPPSNLEARRTILERAQHAIEAMDHRFNAEENFTTTAQTQREAALGHITQAIRTLERASGVPEERAEPIGRLADVLGEASNHILDLNMQHAGVIEHLEDERQRHIRIADAAATRISQLNGRLEELHTHLTHPEEEPAEE